MKCIIAGGRDYSDIALVEAAIADCPFAHEITCVVSGGAQGIDTLGEEWAILHGLPVERYEAAWAESGRKAGPLRNQQMAENADALIAIPGAGNGTYDMIRRARARGLFVFVHAVAEHNSIKIFKRVHSALFSAAQ